MNNPVDLGLPLPERYTLRDHVIFSKEKAIGILNPGLLFAEDRLGGKLQIIGPKGAAWTRVADPSGILAALLATGALLLGREEDILRVQSHLLSPITSRTTSYLCCILSSCDEIVQFFETVSSASVAVVGCGGIGSLAALLLAGIGFRKMVLVDSDVIEESNFNRQLLWSVSDIGSLKVEVLAKRLAERYSGIETKVVPVNLSASNMSQILRRADAILFAGDEPIGLVQEVRTYARRSEKPFVSAGYFFSEAVLAGSEISVAIANHAPCRLPNSIAPSFGPTNVQVAGAAVANLALRLGRGLGDSLFLATWQVHRWPWEVSSP